MNIPSRCNIPMQINRITQAGRVFVNGIAPRGNINKIATRMINKPLQRLVLLLVNKNKRGRLRWSIRVSKAAPFIKTSFICFELKWRSINVAGNHGPLFKTTPIPIKTISRPNGVLVPGIDIGNKNGIVNRIQNNHMPCSPTRLSRLRRLTWSVLIASDVNCSASESFNCVSFIERSFTRYILVLLGLFYRFLFVFNFKPIGQIMVTCFLNIALISISITFVYFDLLPCSSAMYLLSI